MAHYHTKDLAHDRLLALVEFNPETGIFTRRKDSKIWKPGKDGRVVVGINSDLFLAHRLAWFYMTGTWPKDQIDHINRDQSDNRWCNLREATQLENQQNKSAYQTSKSKIKGIVFDPRWSGRYCADVCVNGVKHRARLKTLQEAIDWRANKVQELQPFAPTNL